MYAFRLRAVALALTAGIGLAACTTPYGYNGVSVGIGNGGYYDPYYGGYGYGAGYGYGSGYGYGAGYPGYGYGYGFDPYWGWNDGFYYPGTGYYVYDQYRRPFRWTDAQRRYWELRRRRALETSTTSNPVVVRDNWGDFDRRGDNKFGRVVRKDGRQVRVQQNAGEPVSVERSKQRIERRQQRVERSQQRVERSQQRSERSSARVERKSEARSERVTRSNGRERGNEREE